MNYIGFDLGDGESSIALLKEYNKTPQTVLIDGEESFPTAVATLKSSNAHIFGRNAIDNENSCYDFQVCFKSDFVQNKNVVYSHYQRFLGSIVNILRDKIADDIFDVSKYQFIIGHPADWNFSTVNDYEGLIKSCYIPQPLLVSESRAALVYYATVYTLSGSFQNKFLKSILVCDFGSSTLDIAYLPDGNTDDIVSLGDKKLGGGLIDKMIVYHSIEQYNRQNYDLMSIVKNNRSLLSLLSFKARELKEKYFLEDNEDVEFSKDIPVFRDGIETVNITVNKKIIELALNTPIPECNNRSFVYALDSAIKEAKNSIGQKKIDYLILTGGSSRMKFFREMCDERFGVKHFLSKSPETDIAKGLALDGDYKFRINLLSKDVKSFAGSDRIDLIINENLEGLYKDISVKIVDDMTSEEVADNQNLNNAVNVWVENGNTRYDLETRFGKTFKNYLDSSRFINLLSSVVLQWLDDLVLPCIQKELNELCKKYKLSSSRIEFKRNLIFPKFELSSIKLAKFNIAFDLITLMLNFTDIGSQLPLPRFIRRAKASRILSEHNQTKMIDELVNNLESNRDFTKNIKDTISLCLKDYIHTMSVELRV